MRRMSNVATQSQSPSDDGTPEEINTANTPSEAIAAESTAFRPLTRMERRNLWLKEYGEQDFALQMWVRLVEQQNLEIEMMLQMHGLLVIGVMVSTQRYAQSFIDLNEELHCEGEPETADTLSEYYTALIPPQNQPEIGPEGLPVLSRYIHMCDVTILTGGHTIKVPYWRGKINQVDAFVVGVTVGE